MKTIIAQIKANVVEEILKSIEKNGISDIGKTAESLLSVLKGGAIGAFISSNRRNRFSSS